MKAICGTYVENGTSCGRKTFQKETDKETDQVVIYYWDDRDGPGMQGWWFGNTLAGPQARNAFRKAFLVKLSKA